MKLLVVGLLAICCFGQQAITTKDVLACNRKVSVFSENKSPSEKRLKPYRTIGMMGTGEEGWVYLIVSINDSLYINWVTPVFPTAGEHPGFERGDEYMNAHIRRVDDSKSDSPIYADTSSDTLAKVVGMFH